MSERRRPRASRARPRLRRREALLVASAVTGVLATGVTSVATAGPSAAAMSPWAAGVTTSSSAGLPADVQPTAAALSRSGRHVAVGSTRFDRAGIPVRSRISLVDRLSGASRDVLQTLGVGVVEVPDLVLTPGGRYVGATINPGYCAPGCFLQAVVHDSWTARTTRLPGETVALKDLSDDGRFALAQTDDTSSQGLGSVVHVVEVATGRTSDIDLPSGEPDTAASAAALSGDGRQVLFTSANPHVPDDRNGTADAYLRDMSTGSTRRVSTGPAGAEPGERSGAEDLSPDGRYALFTSYADGLVPDDANGLPDLFVRDLTTREVRLVSRDDAQRPIGVARPDHHASGAISADGRFIAFTSPSQVTRLDANGALDVVVRDRQTRTSHLVSRTPTGSSAAGASVLRDLSRDGRHVVFLSEAPDLVRGDRNGRPDVFVRDVRGD